VQGVASNLSSHTARISSTVQSTRSPAKQRETELSHQSSQKARPQQISPTFRNFTPISPAARKSPPNKDLRQEVGNCIENRTQETFDFREPETFFDYGNVFTERKRESTVVDPVRKDESSVCSAYEDKLFAETLRAPYNEATEGMQHDY